MPIYTYKCVECEKCFDIKHSMNEKCTKCIFEGCSGSVIKVLGNITVKKQKTETKKIGSVVESHIEEAKQEVKAEKDRMKKVEYKPE
tara:strand:- start:287 stop:547 length:261 start_codon:yes stop_codon:yes gene_type:complete